jgi:hypothetical protein
VVRPVHAAGLQTCVCCTLCALPQVQRSELWQRIDQHFDGLVIAFIAFTAHRVSQAEGGQVAAGQQQEEGAAWSHVVQQHSKTEMSSMAVVAVVLHCNTVY